MVATNWIFRFWSVVCLLIKNSIPISAFSTAQPKIRIGLCSNGVQEDIIEAWKQQDRAGTHRDPAIYGKFSAWEISEIRDQEVKIREDSTPETLLFCWDMTSRRLVQFSWSLEAVCVEISTFGPNFKRRFMRFGCAVGNTSSNLFRHFGEGSGKNSFRK
jgi:hypothetical protein